MTLITSLSLIGLLGVALYQLIRRFRRISISNIPGPSASSYVLGHLSELAKGQAAEVEFRWNEEFGDVLRTKGFMGEDRLVISDPKALQYMFQSSGYNFRKEMERRESSRLVTGKGILWADGHIHKRQRKVLLPGFSGPEAKGYLPVFSSYAAKMAAMWKDIIDSNSDQTIIDIPSWASRCALDAIGEVAFDYQFGTLDDGDNALGKAFANLLLDTFGVLSNRDIFISNVMVRLPAFIREFIGDNLPSKKLRHAHNTTRLAKKVARELVRQKAEAALQGKGNRDIMSLLVKANISGNSDAQLSEEEMLGLMQVIILAGHETTANTLGWMLLELSRRPDMQTKLRDEIRAVEHAFQGRGDSHYTAADLDAMPYLNAVLKETLRYHPVVIALQREAVKDDVIPLSKPITTTSGDVINEIPIPKGLKVMASIATYNRQAIYEVSLVCSITDIYELHRNKEIFGKDADIYNPERWLDSRVKKLAPIGVLGNLMSFGSGIRACIGWKFAVIELQSFIFELLGNFEFLPTPDSAATRREAALVMVPTVEGQIEKGAQLRLGIRVVSREE